MPLEIERKFLVNDSSWREAAQRSVHIRQGYLFSDPTMSLRVRILDDRDAVITFKAGAGAVSRGEYEYAVPMADALELIALSGERLIEKRRHHVPFADKDWVVDEFLGRHAGLVVAEIELRSEEEAFELPPWVGADVSADPQYRNAELSRVAE